MFPLSVAGYLDFIWLKTDKTATDWSVIVLQSYRNENVPAWIASCMMSVREWAEESGAEYVHVADDGLLGILPDAFQRKVGMHWPMLTDLGRLLWCHKLLKAGAERVLWLDADVLVCRAENFAMPESLTYGYAFGRERWVEETGRVRSGVHNALCLFEPDNPLLDFYIHSCLRILENHEGSSLAPQLLGPKWLKFQNGPLQMPLLDCVDMWSPWVVEDFLSGGGPRLTRQLEHSNGDLPPAVNLCGSLLDDATGLLAVERLLAAHGQ